MGKQGRTNNGEGTIYKRRDGRWGGRYIVEAKWRYIYGSSREEVAEKLFRAISERKTDLLSILTANSLYSVFHRNWTG